MRSSSRLRGAAVVLLVGALGSALGCVTYRWGDHDRTEFHLHPVDTPPEDWVRGRPVYHVAVEGVYRKLGDKDWRRDENGAFEYAGFLRKANVFASVVEPDLDGAPPTAPGQVRFDAFYSEDAHDISNFAKAATMPGATSYEFELESTMRLTVTLPGDEELVYEASSSATRHYYTSERRDSARLGLYREVDEANVLSLVRQLRAERKLFAVAP